MDQRNENESTKAVLLIILLCIKEIYSSGPKIECNMKSNEAVCTCGEEYKWGEYGGDRFGVGLFEESIWKHGADPSTSSNKGFKLITYQGCSSTALIRINLDKKYPDLDTIQFRNTAPVKIYFSGSLTRGSLTILFENIHGSAERHLAAGSVVLRGFLDYCARPCGNQYPDLRDQKVVPPGLEKSTCNPCTENSFLHLKFKNVDHVMFHKFWLGSLDEGLSGGPVVKAEDVQTFRIEDGSMRQVWNAGIDAGGCWEGYREVRCQDLFSPKETHKSSLTILLTIFIPVTLILASLVVILPLGLHFRRRNQNRGIPVETAEMETLA